MSKSLTKTPKSRTVSKIPTELAKLHFDNISGWLSAYNLYEASVVLRAALVSFRRRYLMSQLDASKLVGCSPVSWWNWETGKKAMRPSSKKTLVLNGHFTPQHFGLPASVEDFADVERHLAGGVSHA